MPRFHITLCIETKNLREAEKIAEAIADKEQAIIGEPIRGCHRSRPEDSITFRIDDQTFESKK